MAGFDSLFVNDKLLKSNAPLKFTSKEKDMTIYALGNQSARLRLYPAQTQYVNLSTQKIYYFNLDGGKYEFQIQENLKGKWQTTKIINLEIERSIWQKTWFWPVLIGYVLFLIGVAGYLFFLYNYRQKLKMLHVRNQIASDLHDEVGSNLSSIAIFVELLKKKLPDKTPELLSLISKITDNSEESVTLMRDTVWAINPDNDSVDKLLERMESFGIEMLGSKGVGFSFTNQLPEANFGMELRRNVYLVYKEAINNIAKHASATKADCTLIKKNGITQISIKDNGSGFDQNKTFKGNGLKNYKFRSADDNIKVGVDSKVGVGTTVTIEIYE